MAQIGSPRRPHRCPPPVRQLADVVAVHGRRAPPPLPRAWPRCRAPAASTERLSCPSPHSPLHSPSLAFFLRVHARQSAVSMGAVAELAAAASSLPPGFPECAIAFSVMRRSPFNHCPFTAAAVARRRRRCLLPHPALLQPLPAEPRAGRGSGWPRLAWPHHRPASPLASLAGRRPSPAGRTGSDGLLCCDSREGLRARIRRKGGSYLQCHRLR